MNDKVIWTKNPDLLAKIFVLIGLIVLFGTIHFLDGGFFKNAFKLAVSGNVIGLADFLYSYGAWAILISFVLDVFINAGSIFPSIFISTANGLIFGLPLGITISWLAETTGVVISFFLMRFFFRDTAESIIRKSNTLESIDKASGENGLVWMAMARTMPYFPSGILTAIGAISSISARDYIIANLIGKFPSTALEVVVGHDMVHFKDHVNRLAFLVIAVAVFYGGYIYWNKHKK